MEAQYGKQLNVVEVDGCAPQVLCLLPNPVPH